MELLLPLMLALYLLAGITIVRFLLICDDIMVACNEIGALLDKPAMSHTRIRGRRGLQVTMVLIWPLVALFWRA